MPRVGPVMRRGLSQVEEGSDHNLCQSANFKVATLPNPPFSYFLLQVSLLYWRSLQTFNFRTPEPLTIV